MRQKYWIGLAAAMGIALAGCSSMRSAAYPNGNAGTMRRADAGTVSSHDTSVSPGDTATSNRKESIPSTCTNGATNTGKGCDRTSSGVITPRTDTSATSGDGTEYSHPDSRNPHPSTTNTPPLPQ